MTIEEIIDLLIKKYNDDQSKYLKYIQEGNITSNDSFINRSLILQDDKFNDKTKIKGLISAIRLNYEKIEKFLNVKNWMNDDIDVEPMIENNGRITNMIPFQKENEANTFDNYVINNNYQKELYDVCFKFAKCVVSKKICGLHMYGNAGVGKTHLTISIAKYVSNNGKNVVYLNEEYSTELYNKYNQNDNNFINHLFDIFKNNELIIIDDINSEFGVVRILLSAAIEYSYLKNAKLLISSNIYINLSEICPYLFSYNDEYMLNFISYNTKINDSYRREWTDNCIGYATLDKLMALQKNIPAGIFILDNTFEPYKIHDNSIANTNFLNEIETLEKNIYDIMKKYTISIDIKQKIHFSKNPYKYTLRGSFYSPLINNDKVEDCDYYIIYVSDSYDGSYDKFLDIIPTIFNNGLKIIVISNNTVDVFKNKIFDKMNIFKNKNTKINERLKIMFPKLFF